MTGVLVVKLRRDLRATWPRLLLMVIAIAVSLTVFGAVLYAWTAIDRETRDAYLGTEPASATIQFGPGVDAEEIAAIVAQARTRPGVLEAAGRMQFTSDVEVNGEARPNQLQVFAAPPDDELRMANFQVRGGNWPPAPGEVFVRQDSLDLLDIAVGDTVTVETPGTAEQVGGRPMRLRVAGTVYDPSLAPAVQQQTGQAYLSTASLAALGEPDVLDQLKIQVAEPGQTEPSDDRDAVVAGAGEVATWLQTEHGLSIREIQVPEPYAHPHQGQADALLSALLIGAAAALLLATILVATMLNNLFTQQIPQIGIMKAIGAGAGRIGRFYLAMTLLVAVVATAAALPFIILLGSAFAPNILSFLGIEPASLRAAWWTYLVVAGVGLLLPVLMAVVPLVKTARTTVRAAIDHHGANPRSSRAAGLLARLGRLPGFDRGLLMALRNTVRRPARFALSVGLLASAGMMFIGGMSARDATAAVADETTERLTWDVTVQLDTPVSVDALAPLIENVPSVHRVEGWTTARAAVSGPGQLPLSRTYPDQGHGGVFVTVIPPDTTLLTEPQLLDGRLLQPGETGAIVLNQVTLNKTGFDVRPGDTVELIIDGDTTTWRVAGIVQERGDSGGAYVTSQGFAAAFEQPQWSNTLRIATDRHDEQTRASVAAAVDDALTGAGITVRSSDSVGIAQAAAGGHLEPIVVILLASALPMGVVGLIGLAATMGANVLDRTREFGVLHAVGARPKTVRRIVTAEGVFVAIASCLVAIIPALGATAVIGAMLGDLFFDAPLPFRVSAISIAVWTVLVVLGAVLATEAAASRAARLTVREALAYL
jgi:putative ABC transport system permease protein